jgi:hypothetical protein
MAYGRYCYNSILSFIHPYTIISFPYFNPIKSNLIPPSFHNPQSNIPSSLFPPIQTTFSLSKQPPHPKKNQKKKKKQPKNNHPNHQKKKKTNKKKKKTQKNKNPPKKIK